MSEVILVGTTVRVKITEPLTAFDGTVVNPDRWTVSVRTPAAEVSVYEWLNPSGDETETIIVPDEGYAYIDITPPDSGVFKVIFKAEPVEDGPDETRTACVKDFVFHVSPLPFEDIE
jgi:hypothetical protein